MDPNSLTYAELPDNLREALLAHVISLAEAAELWDEGLQADEGERRQLPPRLWPAAERLYLFEKKAVSTPRQ